MRASELAALERALAESCPEIGRVSPMRTLGEGFDSYAFVTPDAFVVRVARNEEAMRRHAREVALLRSIRGRLPLPVPDHRCRVEPCSAAPFGATVHKMIEGRQLDANAHTAGELDRIAADLANFLVALHRVPVDDARSVGIPNRGPSELAALRGPVMSILEPHLSAVQRRVLDGWWDELLSDPVTEPSLVHADLWHEHVLVDRSSGRVAGVLDFGDALVADRAADFAPMLYMGRDLTAQVVAAYADAGGDLGPRFDDRLRRCWEIRDVEGLPYVSQHLPTELPEDVEKLLRGPIFDPTAPTW